jgi:DNA polymerase
MIARATLDVETRSQCDITRGNDVYLSHHTTELICADLETDIWKASAAFIPSCDGRDALEAKMREAGLNVVPPETMVAMVKATQTLVAHNFAFEQGAMQKLAAASIANDRWVCTMSRAMRMGLPGGLGNLCAVLGFGDAGKDSEGNRLMKQVSKPRPTWSKKQTGPMWFDDADRLARIALYCARDVTATMRVDKMLPELEPEERDIWLHIHDLNLRGIPVDVEMIHGAIAMSEEAISDVTDRIRAYTGGMVQSLKAPGQLVAWAARYGYDLPSWTKETVAGALQDPSCPEPVRIVALARQEASRGSVAKFEKAAEMVSTDGTLKHQLLYAGTSTLRLAGRGVQPLNLPRPKLMADQSAAKEDIAAGRPIRVPSWKLDYDPERALAAIRAGDLAALRNMGDSEEILSDNIRSMIAAPAGKMIVSPDLSAIEARGVFWLVKCEKALDVIRKSDRGEGPDIYCQLASTMFGFPVIKKKHPEERQYGKVGILQCGYGSGASRVAMANKIEEEMAYKIVQTYRSDYPEVTAAWRDLERSAIEAIRNPGFMIPCCHDRVHFIYEAGWLRMRRPSGTWMYLPDAGIDFEGRLYYHAWIKGAWREESIWGGVLINFVVQGFCREIMFAAEMRLSRDPRFDLFLQCYDSLTSMVPADQSKELCEVMIREMTTPEPWCQDFPLAAEGKPKDRYS